MTGTGGDRGAGIRLEFLARIGEPDQRHQRVGGMGVEEQARIEAGGNARGGGGRDHNPGDPPGREPGFLSVRRTVSWERVAAISPATARPASRRRDPTAEPVGGVPRARATSCTAASGLSLGGLGAGGRCRPAGPWTTQAARPRSGPRPQRPRPPPHRSRRGDGRRRGQHGAGSAPGAGPGRWPPPPRQVAHQRPFSRCHEDPVRPAGHPCTLPSDRSRRARAIILSTLL